MDRSHRRYRELRAAFREGYPLCAACLAEGRHVAGAEVDHVVPLELGGELLDVGNLQHLCLPCHASKTLRQKSCQVGAIEVPRGRQGTGRAFFRTRTSRGNDRRRWLAFKGDA